MVKNQAMADALERFGKYSSLPLTTVLSENDIVLNVLSLYLCRGKPFPLPSGLGHGRKKPVCYGY